MAPSKTILSSASNHPKSSSKCYPKFPKTYAPPSETMAAAISTFFFQAEDGIRDLHVTGVQTCAVPISALGATGPYRDMPGYGILMEGMGGFSARYGLRDERARATSTYYPDLVAVLHGTIAALGALARSEERRVGKECRARWAPRD